MYKEYNKLNIPILRLYHDDLYTDSGTNLIYIEEFYSSKRDIMLKFNDRIINNKLFGFSFKKEIKCKQLLVKLTHNV